MAKKEKEDLKESFAKIGDQFSNLDIKDPGLWPTFPKIFLYLVAAVCAAGAVWVFFVNDAIEELETARQEESRLREEYKRKVAKAVNLDALKNQLTEVQQYVAILERQLPSEAEMDALLSDIGQAGYGRGLQVDLFRPNQVVVRDYYAELPISVKSTGQFHDIAGFAADVANLSRIVTLNNISIKPVNQANADGGENLLLEATAKTFRYLDQSEIDAQRQANQAKVRR